MHSPSSNNLTVQHQPLESSRSSVHTLHTINLLAIHEKSSAKMPSQYQVTEPHPHPGKYVHSGRGGAGNTFKAPKTSSGTSARGPASLLETGLPKSNSKFSSGRGGAGNIHEPSERAIFSFDEELERQSTRERRMKDGAVWHVGRGGAGNWTTTHPDNSRKDSTSSAGSDASARSGFFGRLSHTFERQH
jgi:hypothetical protein